MKTLLGESLEICFRCAGAIAHWTKRKLPTPQLGVFFQPAIPLKPVADNLDNELAQFNRRFANCGEQFYRLAIDEAAHTQQQMLGSYVIMFEPFRLD